MYNKTPTFLTHYFLQGSKPFLNISELDDHEWAELAQILKEKHESDETYNRRFGLGYRAVRLDAEKELRKRFEAKGGKPERQAPHYFCLGASAWWKGFCQHDEIRIDLRGIDSSLISFTYPDSFTSMGVLKRFNIPYESKPYHGQVFTLSEIKDVISEFGLPGEGFQTDYKSYHKEELELYVEAQLWSDKPIEKLICPYRLESNQDGEQANASNP